jgi:ubiquinone biosynthesis protein UbiJ
MLFEAVLGFVNHLLRQEDWPRNRLRSFPGHAVRLEIGSLTVPLSITPDGVFALASRHGQASVTLAMPASALLRGLADRSAVLGSIKVTGSAELADTLSVIFRALRWDVESDLAPLIGDIAAHRLVSSGSQLLDSQRRYAVKMAHTLAETLTDEHSALPSRQMFSAFSSELAALEPQLERIRSRLAKLERSA